MNLARRYPDSRRGVTLIELLVVVSILLMLAVIVLPRVKPTMENRLLRDSARSVNVFFGSARNHAIETGRPCGVMLQRVANNRNACTTMQMVEIPANYSGHTANARMGLTWNGTKDAGGYATVIASLVDPTSVVENTIRLGDRIQFDHQGPWYTVVGVDTSNGGEMGENGYIKKFPIQLRIHLGNDATLPWTSTPFAALPFSVACQPYDNTGLTAEGTLRVRRSANSSLVLPNGIAVDLGVSGTESLAGRFCESDPNQTRPVIIIFSPTGSVDRVISVVTDAVGVSALEFKPTEPLYLLVGRVSQVSMPEDLPLPNPVPTGWTPPDEAIPNWLDTNCFWVTLVPRTGLVTVADNAHLDPPAQSATFKWDDRTTWTASVQASRTYAQGLQKN